MDGGGLVEKVIKAGKDLKQIFLDFKKRRRVITAILWIRLLNLGSKNQGLLASIN